MRGRTPKLTPELQKQIVADVQAGNFVDVVAEAAGVDRATFYNWMNWGRKGRSPYAEFFDAVTRAKSEAELDLVRVAKSGDEPGTSNGEAKCAQWLLERTRGNRYAPRVNVKVEEVTESLLDVVERVCASKDCGCFEQIHEGLARLSSGSPAEELPGEEGSELH